ncbi:hypothetical protein ACB092_01G082800 [Castanea dentata]
MERGERTGGSVVVLGGLFMETRKYFLSSLIGIRVTNHYRTRIQGSKCEDSSLRSSGLHSNLAISCSSKVTQASIPSPNLVSAKITRFMNNEPLEPMLLTHIGFPHPKSASSNPKLHQLPDPISIFIILFESRQ